MRYDRLLKGFSLIGLLVFESTAWAGASECSGGCAGLVNRCKMEQSLRHICQGGDKAGKPCTVMFSGDIFEVDGTGTCESGECPGQCVVVYETKQPTPNQPKTNQPLFVPGTLTILADDHFTAQGNSGAGSQLMVARTILLRVTKEDGSPRFFTDTAVIPDLSDNQVPLEEQLVHFDRFAGPGVEGLKNQFLYRLVAEADQFKGDIAEDIRDMFHAPNTSIPVLADVRGPIVISNHTDADPLGSGLSFEVEIGFACDPNKVCEAVAQ